MFFWRKKEKPLGQIGEDAAVKFLKKKGYKILERNYFNKSGRRLGEIDIIAKKEKEIVFVEVKTRVMEDSAGSLPEESITPAKLHKLSKIANSYIKLKNLWNQPFHFDAISVRIDSENKTAKIRHLENIFI